MRLSKLSTNSVVKLLKKEELAGKFRVLGKTDRLRVRKYYKKQLKLPISTTEKSISKINETKTSKRI